MTIDYTGKLWRALNPIHARAPLSGEGARLYGGRFNPKGVAALYLSLSVVTALREANQVGSFQPTTLVCYDAEIQHIFDGRSESALAAEGMDLASLAHPGWRDQILRCPRHGRASINARVVIGGLLICPHRVDRSVC